MATTNPARVPLAVGNVGTKALPRATLTSITPKPIPMTSASYSSPKARQDPNVTNVMTPSASAIGAATSSVPAPSAPKPSSPSKPVGSTISNIAVMKALPVQPLPERKGINWRPRTNHEVA